MAPFLVTAIELHFVAKSKHSFKVFLFDNATAKAPQKLSPAAVVSIARTLNAFCSITPSLLIAIDPFSPNVMMTFFVPLSNHLFQEHNYPFRAH